PEPGGVRDRASAAECHARPLGPAGGATRCRARVRGWQRGLILSQATPGNLSGAGRATAEAERYTPVPRAFSGARAPRAVAFLREAHRRPSPLRFPIHQATMIAVTVCSRT